MTMPTCRSVVERCRLPVWGFLLVVSLVVARPADAHSIFKKTIEKKYDNLRVTCNMCHIPKEPKQVRNEFGKLFYEELKDQNLSARWNAVKGAERKSLEDDVMAPAILKALEKVVEKETEDGRKFGDLIVAGQIEGSKLKSDSSASDAEEEEEDGG